MIPLDEGLEQAMDVVFEIIKSSPSNDYSDDQIRMSIAANNFKQLVNLILMADSSEGEIEINLKQLSLGILATADWLAATLPEELK